MAACDWFLEATRSMFYLRGPEELALSDGDPAPQYFLRHGAHHPVGGCIYGISLAGLPMFFIIVAIEAALVASRKLSARSGQVQ